MVPIWTDSAGKHGISRADAIYALLHANYSDVLDDDVLDGYVALYIGRPHSQSMREIEVLVNHRGGGLDSVVFHVMELGSKYRKYREENPK